MARIDALEFALEIQDDCDRSPLVISYDIRILDNTVVKIRAILSSDTFIDVFYNADSGKRSYTLVSDGKRVFGADNAFIGWHIHPFEDPEHHTPSPEISFEAFLKAIENHEIK